MNLLDDNEFQPKNPITFMFNVGVLSLIMYPHVSLVMTLGIW
jgi:hypothetical protein